KDARFPKGLGQTDQRFFAELLPHLRPRRQPIERHVLNDLLVHYTSPKTGVDRAEGRCGHRRFAPDLRVRPPPFSFSGARDASALSVVADFFSSYDAGLDRRPARTGPVVENEELILNATK